MQASVTFDCHSIKQLHSSFVVQIFDAQILAAYLHQNYIVFKGVV